MRSSYRPTGYLSRLGALRLESPLKAALAAAAQLAP
jgi:hypothetical protein